MSYLLKAALFTAAVGGLVHLGLTAIPPALRAQDAVACRYQQDLPGISPARRAHCARR